jgi:hypothetical protein
VTLRATAARHPHARLVDVDEEITIHTVNPHGGFKCVVQPLRKRVRGGVSLLEHLPGESDEREAARHLVHRRFSARRGEGVESVSHREWRRARGRVETRARAKREL